jgi:hypothetical protein
MIKGIGRKEGSKDGIKGKIEVESYASVSDPAILGSPKPSPWCSLPRQDSVVCLLDLLLSCYTGFALLTFVYFLLLLLFSCFFFCFVFILVLSSIHQFSPV